MRERMTAKSDVRECGDRRRGLNAALKACTPRSAGLIYTAGSLVTEINHVMQIPPSGRPGKFST